MIFGRNPNASLILIGAFLILKYIFKLCLIIASNILEITQPLFGILCPCVVTYKPHYLSLKTFMSKIFVISLCLYIQLLEYAILALWMLHDTKNPDSFSLCSVTKYLGVRLLKIF